MVDFWHTRQLYVLLLFFWLCFIFILTAINALYFEFSSRLLRGKFSKIEVSEILWRTIENLCELQSCIEKDLGHFSVMSKRCISLRGNNSSNHLYNFFFKQPSRNPGHTRTLIRVGSSLGWELCNCLKVFVTPLNNCTTLNESKIETEIKMLRLIWLLMRVNAPAIWWFWDHLGGLQLSLGFRTPSYLKSHYRNRVGSLDDKEPQLND